MKLWTTGLNTVLKYFITRFSSINYCLFLMLKFCALKVNGLQRLRRFDRVSFSGFLLLEVVVALALSLCIVSFFGLSLGHALFRLRDQRDRLTALCYARSALSKCMIDRAGAGTSAGSYGRFSTMVTRTVDPTYPRLLHYVSTASWSSGSVSLHTGSVI
jgi:hypothetical protein